MIAQAEAGLPVTEDNECIRILPVRVNKSGTTAVSYTHLDVYKRQLFGYCTILRSMTGGRGTYSYEFARYEQAPSDVQEAEIAKRAAEE